MCEGGGGGGGEGVSVRVCVRACSASFLPSFLSSFLPYLEARGMIYAWKECHVPSPMFIKKPKCHCKIGNDVIGDINKRRKCFADNVSSCTDVAGAELWKLDPGSEDIPKKKKKKKKKNLFAEETVYCEGGLVFVAQKTMEN